MDKTFRKNIDLPLEVKNDLRIQAIKEGYENPKNMIEQKVLKDLDRFKKENK